MYVCVLQNERGEGRENIFLPQWHPSLLSFSLSLFIDGIPCSLSLYQWCPTPCPPFPSPLFHPLPLNDPPFISILLNHFRVLHGLLLLSVISYHILLLIVHRPSHRVPLPTCGDAFLLRGHYLYGAQLYRVWIVF